MNQFLDSLTYDEERGTLSLHAARYLLLPPGILVELQKAIETELPYDVAAILSQAAVGEGAGVAQRFVEVFGYTGEQVLSSISFMLAESGWGKIAIEMINLEGREVVIRVDDSPFAELYGPSTIPVCHVLLGLFQGTAMTLFESEVDAQEVQCLAKGDNCCRMAITAKR